MRAPWPRRFSAVSAATSVPGPKSSTQSAPASARQRETVCQSTGVTSCATATVAARSPAARRSRPSPGDSTGNASIAGSGSRPGSAASCARSSAHGSRRAGVWNATSTSSGVQPKRSGAPPRRPLRRSACSLRACSASRARSSASVGGGPPTTIRRAVLTSATEIASASPTSALTLRSTGSKRASRRPEIATSGGSGPDRAASAACVPTVHASRTYRASSASSIPPAPASATSSAASSPCECPAAATIAPSRIASRSPSSQTARHSSACVTRMSG